MVGHTTFWPLQRQLIPLPSLCDGEGSSLPGLVSQNGMFESGSEVGIKLSDYSVVIGYQTDEFIHTIAYTYSGFMGKGLTGLPGKMSTLVTTSA